MRRWWRLGLVEGVAEAVWSAVQGQLAWWQESVWARCGLVLVVVLLRGIIVIVLGDVVILLTNGWDGSGSSWCLVLVIIVVGRSSWTLNWPGTAITLESWVVPSLVISSIVELVRGVVLIDVVALRLGRLILWLNRLRDRLWRCWWSDWQVVAGGLESKRVGGKINCRSVHYANAFTLQFLRDRSMCGEIYWFELHVQRHCLKCSWAIAHCCGSLRFFLSLAL